MIGMITPVILSLCPPPFPVTSISLRNNIFLISKKMNPLSLFPFVHSNEGFHPDLDLDLDFDFDFDFDFLHVDRIDEDSDATISQWELVNPSDADDSYDPSDLEYVCYNEHDVTDGSVEAVKFAPLVEVSSYGNSPPLINQYISSEANLNPSAEAKITDSVIAGNVGADGDGDEYRNEHDYDHEDDDDEEEEYDDGLDDELVPRPMRGKLGKERIRKIGKRGCSKMKRGCLHGKHGFGVGLKNSF